MDQTVTQAAERLGISLGQAFGAGVIESMVGTFTQMQARSEGAENL